MRDLQTYLEALDPDAFEPDTPEARYKIASQEREALYRKYTSTTDGKEVRMPFALWSCVDRIKLEGANYRCGVYASRLAKLDAADGIALRISCLALGGSIECRSVTVHSCVQSYRQVTQPGMQP